MEDIFNILEKIKQASEERKKIKTELSEAKKSRDHFEELVKKLSYKSASIYSKYSRLMQTWIDEQFPNKEDSNENEN